MTRGRRRKVKDGSVMLHNSPAPYGYRKEETGGKVECFVLREREPGLAECLLRSSASKLGLTFQIADKAAATVVDACDGGAFLVRFSFAPGTEGLQDLMSAEGHVPLPPYISREDTEDDVTRYQTVYAREKGSVAAPTAGLHFSPAMLAEVKSKVAATAYVTLHVGLGTFQPIKVEEIEHHKMHAEYFCINAEAASCANATRARGGRRIAVGTTTVRALESGARAPGSASGTLSPAAGFTDLFLYPGARFQAVDAMLTNFHQPRSSLLVMMHAFMGRELVERAYNEALKEKYRFLSYGDCMLVL